MEFFDVFISPPPVPPDGVIVLSVPEVVSLESGSSTNVTVSLR